MADTLEYRIIEEVRPDLVIMAIIEPDFDLSRTGVVDKWGYTMDRNLSGIIPKDSLLKRMLRGIHLSYLCRDLRYSLMHRVDKSILKASEYSVPDSYVYIKKFADIAKENSIPCLIVLLPRFSDGYAKLIERLTEDRIDCLDIGFIKDEFPSKVFKASKFDQHPSAMVHRRIAEALADYMLRHGLIR